MCVHLQLPQLEVWFQRASDVVRKLVYGDVDLGIVGFDMLSELAHANPDLVVLHDALAFGKCHLGLGVPMQGRFADVHTINDLRRQTRLHSLDIQSDICTAAARCWLPGSAAYDFGVACSCHLRRALQQCTSTEAQLCRAACLTGQSARPCAW